MRSGGIRGLVRGICGGEARFSTPTEREVAKRGTNFDSFDNDKLDLYGMLLEMAFGMVRCVREIPGTRDYA